MADRGRYDQNNRVTLTAVSNADGETPVSLWADPTTHRLLTGLSGLINFKFDYLSVNYASGTQEVYTFKTGGSGGTTVGTLTINYTDSTKANLSNATLT